MSITKKEKTMAFVTGGKHFGQYTFEHWYDQEYEEKAAEKKDENKETQQLGEEEKVEKEKNSKL